MATKLNKKISRETGLQEIEGKYRGRTFVVDLNTDGSLTVRIKGTRQRFTAGFYDIVRLAKIRSAIEIYDEKYRQYKSKKDMGVRAIKPKVPGMIGFYSPAYAAALKIKVKRK